MTEELLSTAEAAHYLGVHEKQIYVLIREKRIPGTRLTGKWVFPRKLLEECIVADARRNLASPPEEPRRQAVLAAGSDDPLLAFLAGELHSCEPGVPLYLAPTGSTAGLKALNRGEVDLSFSHLFDPKAGEYNLPYLEALVPDRRVAAVTLFRREIGFVVAAGNPKRLRSFRDLGKKGLRLVNRQAGSGTRVLLEQELARVGVRSVVIDGWDREVSTHYDVALAVKAGDADMGIASASVAHLLGLGFVPQREERFDMGLDRSIYFERRFQTLLDRLASAPFRERAVRMGGYDFRDAGHVLTGEA